MLLCCLIHIRIILLKHLLHLVYLCFCLSIDLFISYLCDSFSIIIFIFIIIINLTSYNRQACCKSGINTICVLSVFYSFIWKYIPSSVGFRPVQNMPFEVLYLSSIFFKYQKRPKWFMLLFVRIDGFFFKRMVTWYHTLKFKTHQWS